LPRLDGLIEERSPKLRKALAEKHKISLGTAPREVIAHFFGSPLALKFRQRN